MAGVGRATGRVRSDADEARDGLDERGASVDDPLGCCEGTAGDRGGAKRLPLQTPCLDGEPHARRAQARLSARNAGDARDDRTGSRDRRRDPRPRRVLREAVLRRDEPDERAVHEPGRRRGDATQRRPQSPARRGERARRHPRTTTAGPHSSTSRPSRSARTSRRRRATSSSATSSSRSSNTPRRRRPCTRRRF